jgi:hypothetical protein
MSGLTAVQRERLIGCLRLWQHPDTPCQSAMPQWLEWSES